MKRFSILLSAVVALMIPAGMASAAPQDVYTISNIPVDKTASTSQEAESQAFATAQVQGLYRLIEKLTLPEDRGSLGSSFYDFSNARSLAAAVDVDDVRRSTTVYRANLSVVYNPNLIREQLGRYGVAYVDQQTGLSLIVPIASSSSWRDAWPQSNPGALNPQVKAVSSYSANSSWSSFEREVNSTRARNVVIAELLGSPGSYSVNLTRVTSSGRSPLGSTGSAETLEGAVAAATAYLDNIWKNQAIVRRSDARASALATARYSSLSSWNTIRSALSNSPRVSGLQIRALARDGAIIAFEFAGGQDRLQTELRQSGIELSGSASSMTLNVSGDRGF